MADHDLIIEPAVQLAERDHDVFAIGGAFLEPPIPCLDIRDRRPLDLDLEIPVERGCRRNIRQGQTFSAQERTVGEHPIEQSEMPRTSPDLGGDGRQVPLRLGVR
jgi:hypothetical protein